MVASGAVLPAGFVGAVLGVIMLIPVFALGHCDTMNGPVVADARRALAAGDVSAVLKWVKPEAEPEVKAAFKQTMAVRSKGRDALALADRSFFETLVRVHRAGEGAPYTGLKDTPVEPVIARTDAALASGSVGEVVKLLQDALAEGVSHRFERVLSTAGNKDKDVASGREYVDAYVEFTHYVERLHAAIEAAGGSEHHE
jgi:hypothetical protein